MTEPRYPGAPLGSYVCEEGWLVVGDQAWTPEEWNSTDSIHRSGRGGRPGRPRKHTDYAHRRMADRARDRYRARKASAA